jgi:hypothetical protein
MCAVQSSVPRPSTLHSSVLHSTMQFNFQRDLHEQLMEIALAGQHQANLPNYFIILHSLLRDPDGPRSQQAGQHGLEEPSSGGYASPPPSGRRHGCG